LPCLILSHVGKHREIIRSLLQKFYSSFTVNPANLGERRRTLRGLVHVQERCWVMRCSALTSWPSEVAKPLLKVHKTSLSIAQEVA
jgi:hypothetical protein